MISIVDQALYRSGTAHFCHDAMDPCDAQRDSRRRGVVGGLEVEGAPTEGQTRPIRLAHFALRFPEDLRAHAVVGGDDGRLTLSVKRRRGVVARTEHRIAGLPRSVAE